MDKVRERLAEIYEAIKNDNRIGAPHLSLYMALFQLWNLNDFEEPVSIDRPEVLELAKISRSTYQRCINDLHDLGYIKYVPSYHPVLGSIVYMSEWNSGTAA
ncbi:MarR family transcriptional regulator [Chitinophaga sp. Hz27]|uniref:Helix-turn-helix domain-containing protein n=1 Tax=Chitinophaga silvatica TaxID=2282649 RepID=A0A3E1YHA3_9BACT|nr:MarR family transcriptional regulator [Chitinophaga silvatica]RFS26803.1 hypothetical protein DVR12_03180 [Chitinophaga silvatica]